MKKGKKKTAKTFRFSVNVSVTAGRADTVTVKLPGGALSLLKKKIKLAGTFTLTASNANGSTTATAGGTVKPA